MKNLTVLWVLKINELGKRKKSAVRLGIGYFLAKSKTMLSCDSI